MRCMSAGLYAAVDAPSAQADAHWRETIVSSHHHTSVDGLQSSCMKPVLTCSLVSWCCSPCCVCADSKCKECDKSYPQQTALNQHIRTHTKEKPLSDWPQTRTARMRCDLKAAMQWLILHLPLPVCCRVVLNSVCTECKKAFTCKANLKAHTRFHTGEKP
jgi:Zinc finger, C2H2 type